jgi:hypothetical protein
LYYKVYSGVEFFIFAKMVVNLEGGLWPWPMLERYFFVKGNFS